MKKFMLVLICLFSITINNLFAEDFSSIENNFIEVTDNQLSSIEGEGVGGGILMASLCTLGEAGIIAAISTNPYLVSIFASVFEVFPGFIGFIVAGPFLAYRWGYKNLPF